jgi:membrane protein CcdC involved in cytochrome C biogenesis
MAINEYEAKLAIKYIKTTKYQEKRNTCQIKRTENYRLVLAGISHRLLRVFCVISESFVKFKFKLINCP